MDPLDELKAIVAKYTFVEGRKGAPDDWAFFISLKQRWFNMSNSKEIIEKALELGLLKEEEGMLSAAFDVDKIDLPDMFIPSSNLVSLMNAINNTDCKCQCEDEGLLQRIVERILETIKSDEKSVTHEIMKAADETGYTPETAGIIVALSHGAKVEDLLEETRSGLGFDSPSD